MRKYFYNFSNSLQSLAEYRLSLSLDILGNFISNLVIYFLLVSVIGAAAGFDAHNVATDIRDGDINPFLLKPVSYMWLKFTATFPHSLLKLSVGILIFISLRFLGLSFSSSASDLILFFVALFLSILGNYLIYFAVGLFAFWTKHIFGLASIVSIGSSLVSGRIIPLELLPPSIIFLSNFLPFRYFIFFPVQIFMNKLILPEILSGLAMEIFWITILYLLSLLVWKTGQKQLEAVGI